MKNYKSLTLIALCFLFAACKKDQLTIGEFSSVKTTANANVLAVATGSWKATTTNTGFYPKTTQDTLVISGSQYDQSFINTTNLTILLKQKGAGTYKGSEIKAYFYSIIGTDVISGNYLLDATADNEVVITDYDKTNHELKGTFNLTFKNAFVNYTTTTIKLINGKIYISLSDQFIYPIKY